MASSQKYSGGVQQFWWSIASLRTYTQSGGQGKTTIDAAEAVAALQRHYELCCDMLHGLDYTKWTTGTPAERATLPQLGTVALSWTAR